MAGFAVVAVEGFEVEIELAEVGRLEAGGLELDGDEAIQPAMKEKQVQSKILPAHLERVFGADKAKIPPQLGDEAPQIAQQAAVQICLGMVRRQAEKFECVGVFEDVQSLGVQLPHQWCDFYGMKNRALKSARAELALQLAAGPFFMDGEADIKLPLHLHFALTQNDQVVRPRQLSQQCRDNFIFPVSLVKLLHPEKIGACESSQPRLGAGEEMGQFIHDSIAPLSGGEFAADVFPNLPVKRDELAVDALIGPLSGGLDEVEHLAKRAVGGSRKNFHQGAFRLWRGFFLHVVTSLSMAMISFSSPSMSRSIWSSGRWASYS